MSKHVKEIMLPLSEYAVVDEGATLLDAFRALATAQATVPPGRQPHRAVLVRNHRGEIIGKVHYFAFLRALTPDRSALRESSVLERAGVADDLRDSSMRMLDLLTGDFVDLWQRARSVRVRDVYTSATVSIQEDAALLDAMLQFRSHQTLSLLVRRGEATVGILRLSDLFDEISAIVLRDEPAVERT